MSKFIRITKELLAADEKFVEYLRRADIKPAKKGGAFVGNYEVAPDEFRKYGIVLPKGGMIIPDSEPEALTRIVRGVHVAEAAKRCREQEEDEARRRAARTSHLEDMKQILEKASSLGFTVEEECSTDLSGSYQRMDLCRDGEKCFLLIMERGDDEWGGGPPKRSAWYTPKEEVSGFLLMETELIPARQAFTERFAGEGFSFAKFVLDAYSSGPCTLQCAHSILFHRKRFLFTQEGFSAIEREMSEPFKEIVGGFNDDGSGDRPGYHLHHPRSPW